MKRNIFWSFMFLVISFWSNTISGQRNLIQIAYQLNALDFNPNINVLREKYDYKITSKTQSLNLSYNLIQKKRFNYNVGFCYKKTNYRVYDRITHWNYTTTLFSTGVYYYDTIYQVYDDPADLVAYSHNYGLFHEVNIELKHSKYFQHNAGLTGEVYLLEYFKSYYETKDEPISDLPSSANKPSPKFYQTNRLFKVYSSNLSVYYRLTLLGNDYVSVSTKLSLGTNLYSDWDQFKKYAWLGVGFELGFGKKRVKEQKAE